MTTTKAKNRNLAYQRRFNLPEDEQLVDEFNCALQDGILRQGKLYISQNYACFYSNIFGMEVSKILPASDITGVQLAKVLFIPNSIKVYLTYETYFFASFLHRDDAYRLLTKISRGESIAHMGKYSEENGHGNGASSDHGDEEDEDRLARGASSPGAGQSKIRHASLLSDNANRLKSENEKKRQEQLKQAQKQLDEESSRDPSRSEHHDEEEEEDEPAPPPKRNGKSNTLTVASSTTAVKHSKSAPPPRKYTSENSDSRGSSIAPPPVTNGKGRKQSRDFESDGASSHQSNSEPEDEDPVDEPTPPPITKRGKGQVEPTKGGKGGKAAANAAFLAASSNASFQLPRVAEQKQAKFYEFEFKVVDPAVTELQANKFKNKKYGLDQPPESCRRLIYQGAMKRQGNGVFHRLVDRWCFLFHDFFLFTKYDEKKGTNYIEKQKILLENLIVDMRPPSYQLDELKKTKLPQAFRLLDNNPKQPVQYICGTQTIQEKINWGQHFTQTISRWHANPKSKSTVDRTKVGWYHLFVRGLLPHAVITNDEKLLVSLLGGNQKENINDVDQEGYSLLHLCVLNSTPNLIPVLITNGADLSIRDFNGYTALTVAVIEGKQDCLDEFIKSGKVELGMWHPILPKESKFLRERSALWLAAVVHYKTNPLLAEKLIRTLVDLARNMPNFLDERSEKNDMTLLDYCCFNPGMEKIASLIIELGATVDLVNLEGLTPLSQSCRSGNLKMITVLLQSGAQPNLRFHKLGLNSSIFYCRDGSGLDGARELVSYGARWQEMKNKAGQRVKDIFPSISQQSFLKQAEEVWLQKAPVIENTTEAMKPPANSRAQNNRHDFDSCCLCQLDFTLVNKREYCRRCGWNVCAQCSSKRMAFVSNSKGKSRNSASTGGLKERVCDGCYNLVAYRKKLAKKKPVADENGVEELADETKKGKGKSASAPPMDDDDEPRPAATSGKNGVKGGNNKPEPSGAKSLKRLDVDTDDDGDGETNGKSDEHDLDADEPDSADEDNAAKAKIAADKKTAEEKKSTSFGGRMSAFFSSKKKEDPVVAAKKEAEKHAALAKQKGRESEEEDDNFERGKKRMNGTNGKAAATPAKGKDAPSTPLGRSKSMGNIAAAATATTTKSPARKPSARDDNSASEPDSDDGGGRSTRRQPGWSQRAAMEEPMADSDPEHTDSDDARRRDEEDDADEVVSPNKKKDNIFQRGFKSATGAVKTAASAVGGAVTSAAKSTKRGVTKLADTVKEKVTAVAVPVQNGDGGTDDEDDDPIVAERARRKEAARARVNKRYAAQQEEEEQEAEAASSRTGKKTASTANTLGQAKAQAQRNQDLLSQMEDRSGEVEDEGAEFQSLATKLKAKSKSRL